MTSSVEGMLRVLVGCEASGVVRDAFRKLGHDAWSCDIRPCEADPAWHFQMDIFECLHRRPDWDIFIAHPDCTFLTCSGLHWNKRRPERAALTEKALLFVSDLWQASAHIRTCFENPQGCINTRLSEMPRPQYIQPHQFGADASKKTGLWLRGLPPLVPTKRIPGRLVQWNGKTVERWANQTDSGQNRLGPSDDRWALRAETYPGVGEAMALQWGGVALAQECAA